MMKIIPVALAVVLCSAASAAVGDVYSTSGKLVYYIDGITDTSPAEPYNVTSVDRKTSTRFYDSNKGASWLGSYNTGEKKDVNMCWAHTATNAIQYWQDIYGVFYNDKGNMAANGSNSARELYNGVYSQEAVTDYDAPLVNGAYQTIELDNVKEMNVSKAFHDGWSDLAGKFVEGIDWYFRCDSSTPKSDASCWTQASDGALQCYGSFRIGGYYSNYFGNHDSETPAYINSSIKYADLETLKRELLPSLGLSMQEDGTCVQTQEGLLSALSIAYVDPTSGATYGHAINCVGFTLDDSGKIESLLITNGDDGIVQMERLYLKVEDSKIKLYRADGENWKNHEWYLRDVSYINTPEVLQNMLVEYRSSDEALVWNGGAGEWKTQQGSNDLPGESTGWDVFVDGDNIAEEHHGYYHSYGVKNRHVRFDGHGEGKSVVTITGMVAPGNIEVAEGAYRFKKGVDAAIAGGGKLIIRKGASLTSELELVGRAMELEASSRLDAPHVVVVGDFKALQSAASFSLREAVVPTSAEVVASLDLTSATALTMEISVDMVGKSDVLSLTRGVVLTMVLREDVENYLFSGIEVLNIDSVQQDSFVDVAENYFAAGELTDLAGYNLVYAADAGTLMLVHSSLSIPEPSSSMLSLLGLSVLLQYRRRK